MRPSDRPTTAPGPADGPDMHRVRRGQRLRGVIGRRSLGSSIVQALVLEAFSGPDAVAVRDVPPPDAAADGAVLVEVRAVAFGPWDIGTTYGAFAGQGGQSAFPQVLGW